MIIRLLPPAGIDSYVLMQAQNVHWPLVSDVRRQAQGPLAECLMHMAHKTENTSRV